ncbi:MAG: DUF924 family protein [Bacteriovoracia bacterium]
MNFQRVHEFWFGEDLVASPLKNRDLWWRRPAGIDEKVRDEFLPTLEAAAAGKLADWESTPEGFVSLILVLDQFPRHIFRGKPRAFAFDAQARALCLKGLAQGMDRKMHWSERQFFLLPLEHAEDLIIQERALVEFDRLVQDTPAEFREYMLDNQRFAVKHHDIIKRFGHFPHRNSILGRVSTAEEIEFLKDPSNSF